MKNILLMVALLLCPAFGSGDRSVPLDGVTIRANRFGVEATISARPDGTSEVTILFNGKVVLIPKEALADIKNIRVESAQFITHTPTGAELHKDWLKGHGFMLSFDYGDSKFHAKDDKSEEVMVFACCRIEISSEGAYKGLNRCIPQGDLKNKWHITERSVEGKDFDMGIEDSIKSPFDE
jgi:hypothetical protein